MTIDKSFVRVYEGQYFIQFKAAAHLYATIKIEFTFLNFRGCDLSPNQE